jgi:hypothetical protein
MSHEDHSRITPDGLRISYTAIALWKRGDMNRFMEYMTGKKSFTTSQMQEGVDYDERAVQTALDTGKLIDEFGSYQLTAPEGHKRIEVNFTFPVIMDLLKNANMIDVDPFQLVGELDLYDAGEIIELKTGMVSSIEYARTMQVPIYMVLAKLNQLPVTGARICHYNQYEKTTDVHKMLVSKPLLKTTLVNIFKTVAQMQQFLKSMNGENYASA